MKLLQEMLNLRDCSVMSGASLKRQCPKIFEAGHTFTIK